MSLQVDLQSVEAGFADLQIDSQVSFRKVLNALTRPGTVETVDTEGTPEGFNIATAAIVLTLVDYDTPIWLSPSLRNQSVASWLKFHCSVEITEDPLAASFAVIGDASELPDLELFNPGDAKYPDQSATIIIQLSSLESGEIVQLSGPGIETTSNIAPEGIPENFWAQRAENVSAFQLGLDFFLTADHELLGLPRTTRTSK